MKNTTDGVLAFSLVVVLIGSFFIERPNITSLALVVILSAHSVLTVFLSENFLQRNMWAVLLSSAAINALAFSAVVFPFWVIMRRDKAALCSLIILSIVVLHLALLFFMFPATDGP